MAQDTRREKRLAHIMNELEARGIPQMLVTDPASIEWLYGFGINPGERFYGLLLRAGSEPLLLVNDLFPTPDDLAVEVRGFRDTDDPIELVASLLDPQAPLGVDKFMAAHFLLPLRDRGAASDFVLGSFAVDGARSIKDADEVELMRRASAVNDEAMGWLLTQVREGVTEVQIADALLEEYKRLGAQGFSFKPIDQLWRPCGRPSPRARRHAPRRRRRGALRRGLRAGRLLLRHDADLLLQGLHAGTAPGVRDRARGKRGGCCGGRPRRAVQRDRPDGPRHHRGRRLRP